MGGRVGCYLLGNGRECLRDQQITTSAREKKLGRERKSGVRAVIRWVSDSGGKEVSVALLSEEEGSQSGRRSENGVRAASARNADG